MYCDLIRLTRKFHIVFPAILFILAVLFAPKAAHAIDLYGGLSVGDSSHETTGGDIVGPGFFGTIDGNDSAYKFMVGMRLWEEYVGVELGYVDLGEAIAVGTVSGLSTKGTSESQAFTFSAIGYIPLGDSFGLTVRLGVFGPDTEVSVNTAGVTTKTKTRDLKVYGGFGMQFDFTKKMAARVEFERYTMGSIGSPYVNVTSAGLVYQFGK